MKHWSEFLLTRTQATVRLGKIARTLTFEVQEKQIQLDNAKANLDRLELIFATVYLTTTPTKTTLKTLLIQPNTKPKFSTTNQ